MADATPPPPASASPYLSSLLAGALAGTLVDVSLFPIDTLKTRLQSAAGFAASGGFRGVYAGLGSAVVGSAPNAALFFVTYESAKAALPADGAAAHMLAASAGETAACAVRVPVEVVKQRAQAAAAPSSAAALRAILARPAALRELYRGAAATLLREVPFTVVQFPLWEALKRWRARAAGRDAATGAESAAFGAASGAVAAALTTPLDVLKTRTMLADRSVRLAPLAARIWRTEGPRVFLAGLAPRVVWISIGGAVFLGSYQWARNMLGGLV